MEGHGSLIIRTLRDEEEDSAALAVQVIDTGCGMSPGVIERVFDPFYTTKPAGQGTGLGMSQVFAFCRQSSGEVQIQSTEGEGTRVAMLLPVAKPAAAAAEDHAGDGEARPAGPADMLNILVVEDDHRVLAATVDAVNELGHRAVACDNPLEAEAMVEGHGGFDLILSDVLMPELTGPEMIGRLKQRWPQLSVLIVTGYAGDASEEASFGDHDVLRKPFTLSALDRAIRRSGEVRTAEGQRLAS
jgi:CheY-like chemotaxis protein